MGCLGGWTHFRPADRGICWKHFVLNEIQARLQWQTLHYWRDKQGHEVDFVIARRGRPAVAIEGKWKDTDLNTRNFKAFLGLYPDAECVTVSSNVDRPYARAIGDATMRVFNLEPLIAHLTGGE